MGRKVLVMGLFEIGESKLGEHFWSRESVDLSLLFGGILVCFSLLIAACRAFVKVQLICFEIFQCVFF